MLKKLFFSLIGCSSISSFAVKKNIDSLPKDIIQYHLAPFLNNKDLMSLRSSSSNIREKAVLSLQDFFIRGDGYPYYSKPRNYSGNLLISLSKEEFKAINANEFTSKELTFFCMNVQEDQSEIVMYLDLSNLGNVQNPLNIKDSLNLILLSNCLRPVVNSSVSNLLICSITSIPDNLAYFSNPKSISFYHGFDLRRIGDVEKHCKRVGTSRCFINKKLNLWELEPRKTFGTVKKS